MFEFFPGDVGVISAVSDRLVDAGDSVRLSCNDAMAGGVRWERNRLGEVTVEYLSFPTGVNVKLKDRMFVVSDHPGQYDLVINRTQLDDAGVYRCMSAVDESNRGTIELSVFGIYTVLQIQ